MKETRRISAWSFLFTWTKVIASPLPFSAFDRVCIVLDTLSTPNFILKKAASLLYFKHIEWAIASSKCSFHPNPAIAKIYQHNAIILQLKVIIRGNLLPYHLKIYRTFFHGKQGRFSFAKLDEFKVLVQHPDKTGQKQLRLCNKSPVPWKDPVGQ
jgi:hypothetical protein